MHSVNVPSRHEREDVTFPEKVPDILLQRLRGGHNARLNKTRVQVCLTGGDQRNSGPSYAHNSSVLHIDPLSIDTLNARKAIILLKSCF